jgi:hypothetical protein
LIDVVSWVVTKRKDSEIFLLEMTLHKFYSKHFNAAAKKKMQTEKPYSTEWNDPFHVFLIVEYECIKVLSYFVENM